MARLNGITDGTTQWVQNASYNAANQLSALVYTTVGTLSPYPFTVTEVRSYNSNLQLTALTATSDPNGGPSGVNVSYTYSATQNNGEIQSMKNSKLSETVQYQYDAIKRLTSATAGSHWGLSFTY